jgi:hypothetical protein
MATTTKIISGKFYDGVTSATGGYAAKKINDITTGAASFQFSIAVKGNRLIAAVVYA